MKKKRFHILSNLLSCMAFMAVFGAAVALQCSFSSDVDGVVKLYLGNSSDGVLYSHNQQQNCTTLTSDHFIIKCFALDGIDAVVDEATQNCILNNECTLTCRTRSIHDNSDTSNNNVETISLMWNQSCIKSLSFDIPSSFFCNETKKRDDVTYTSSPVLKYGSCNIACTFTNRTYLQSICFNFHVNKTSICNSSKETYISTETYSNYDQCLLSGPLTITFIEKDKFIRFSRLFKLLHIFEIILGQFKMLYNKDKRIMSLQVDSLMNNRTIDNNTVSSILSNVSSFLAHSELVVIRAESEFVSSSRAAQCYSLLNTTNTRIDTSCNNRNEKQLHQKYPSISLLISLSTDRIKRYVIACSDESPKCPLDSLAVNVTLDKTKRLKFEMQNGTLMYFLRDFFEHVDHGHDCVGGVGVEELSPFTVCMYLFLCAIFYYFGRITCKKSSD